MDCIRVSQNLDDYLDGELGRIRQHAVARHLYACAACSAGFTFEVQVRQLLWQKCRDEPPEGLRDRILEALAVIDPTALPPNAFPGPLPGPFDAGRDDGLESGH
ncbi:MAG: zf-HC2 domain-containing protein [Actinobacteria bacterium]|nr:zf-HC2 domain-containing protein [Actinomycetota bacterium]